MRWLFTARTFFVLCACFIVYATTIPWDMTQAPTLEGVAWVPFWDTTRGRIWSIPDMVQNVILFLPFGLFGYLGLPFLRRRASLVGVGAVAVLGFGLSLSVEAVQTMSAVRVTSATDLATNFIGALIGAVAAAIYDARLRPRARRLFQIAVERNPGLLIFALYLSAAVFFSLQPFIPSLDVGLLRASARALLDNPWGDAPLGGLVSNGLLFSVVAFLCAREVPAALGRQTRLPLFRAEANPPVAVALFSVASTSALVLALEFGQLFIRGRSPGLRDALVSVTCVVFASGLAAWWPRGGVRGARSLGELTRSTPWFVLAFAVLAPTLRALQPFELGDVHAELEALTFWRFVPFATLFKNLNPWTFWNVFEASVVYLPLGYALFASGRSPGFGFMVCAGLAVLLEVLQIPIVGRTFDITEGIYAGLMALAGVWLFTSLRELSASEQGENRGAPTIDLPDVGRRARNVRVPPPEAATVPLQVPPRRKG